MDSKDSLLVIRFNAKNFIGWKVPNGDSIWSKGIIDSDGWILVTQRCDKLWRGRSLMTCKCNCTNVHQNQHGQVAFENDNQS